MGLSSREKKVPLSEVIDELLVELNEVWKQQHIRQIEKQESLVDVESGSRF